MTSVYCITRGHLPCVEAWADCIKSQMLPFKYTEPITKKEMTHIQLGIRPVQFWEITFPKEHTDLMLNSIWSPKYNDIINSSQYEPFKFPLAMIRKALGINPMPKKIEGNQRILLMNDAVAIYPVGIKDDTMNEAGHENL